MWLWNHRVSTRAGKSETTVVLAISGYFWGAEGLSKDFLKPKEEEFGAQLIPNSLIINIKIPYN